MTLNNLYCLIFQDVTGKITIDFKDPHSLRVLTKCLLKSDFNLDVDIPKDRLVPTLPLRLNYILWLEDLLDTVQRKEKIWGLDIGRYCSGETLYRFFFPAKTCQSGVGWLLWKMSCLHVNF